MQHRLLTHSCGRSLHAHDYAARVIPLDSYRSNLVGYHTDPQGISGGFLRLPNSSIAAFEVPGATVNFPESINSAGANRRLLSGQPQQQNPTEHG